MKANRQQIEAALRGPAADVRFFLLHGPDEAGSRALIRLLASAIGPAAERVLLSGQELRSDPARLVDEASSLSLFGGARFIVVESTGDEAAAALEGLLEAAGETSPVAVVTGALKPTSRLLKLALARPDSLAFASYVPEGRNADRLVADSARAQGLTVQPHVARLIAEASGGNRALIDQELAKYALYLDAAPDRPRDLQAEVLEALGTSAEEGELGRLVDAVAGGDGETLGAEIVRLSSGGIEGIQLLRAVIKRMMLLARLRASVERGSSVGSVMASEGKAVFWKEKDAVAHQLSRWRSDLLATAIGRLLEAERQVKAPGALGNGAVSEELFAICRRAARLR